MSQIISSAFTKYLFSKEERFILSDTQIQFIQTRRAEIAEQKIAMTLDPEKPIEVFIQQEAYLAGQLAILQYLVDESIATEAAMLEEAKQHQ